MMKGVMGRQNGCNTIIEVHCNIAAIKYSQVLRIQKCTRVTSQF